MDAWVRSGTPSGAWQRAHTCSVVTTSGLGPTAAALVTQVSRHAHEG